MARQVGYFAMLVLAAFTASAQVKRPAVVAPKPAPKAAAAKPAPKPAPQTAARSAGTAARTRQPLRRTRVNRFAYVRRTPVIRVPLTPTPERYKEIQEALATKGFFQEPPNGTWGPSSIDALRRFQRDQKLSETGRLDALSLIAMGLGPKRNPPSKPATETRPTDDNRRTEGSERP